MKARYIIRNLQLLIAALWAPVAAFAGALAASGSTDSPLNVPPVLLLTSVFIATMAGATTLAMQLVKELKENALAGTPDKALNHPWLNAGAHMLGSWLTSTFFFIICMAQQAGVWIVLGTVLLGAFAGAKVLEKLSDTWLLSRLPGPPAT